MRQEILDLLRPDESKNNRVVAEAITELGPTQKEKRELCSLLHELDEEDWLGRARITGVMKFFPDPIYFDSLARLARLGHTRKAAFAFWTLLQGNYEGALDVLFEDEDRLLDVGDWIITDLRECQERFDWSQQQQIQQVFCRRFATLPPRSGGPEGWLSLVAFLPENTEETSATLMRAWEAVDQEDIWYPRDIMLPIRRHPHEMHRELLKAARKNRNGDIRWLAREALKELDGAE